VGDILRIAKPGAVSPDAGLGLRRSMLPELEAGVPAAIGFVEVAPENWIGVGGRLGRRFREITERVPLYCHGLSLSLGSVDPLDFKLLSAIRDFLDVHRVQCYSEHLSYCSDGGHLYDLMPIPFTDEAVRHVAGRIRQVQDFLERPIAVENVSYYAAPGQQMTEQEFLLSVLDEANCELLLDVNNIHVNSINHHYDAHIFLDAMPAERIAYVHVAGHYVEAPDLRVDTHGADVIDPVWQLLERAYRRFGIRPTLLERDFNIPPLDVLLEEVRHIDRLQQGVTPRTAGSGSPGFAEAPGIS